VLYIDLLSSIIIISFFAQLANKLIDCTAFYVDASVGDFIFRLNLSFKFGFKPKLGSTYDSHATVK